MIGLSLATLGVALAEPIPYATVQKISEGDSAAVIAEKAAKVLPRPRQNSLNGVVENYRFETSPDGLNWTTNVVEGRFGNIRNNPVLQEVTFAPVTARFFRFTALKGVDPKGWTSAAELSVLPASWK
jgi:alpha-L-fucosidase